MSKEHYVTPEEFDEMCKKGKLKKISYKMHTGEEVVTENVINSLRELNKRDPGFKYTCRCNEDSIVWSFGYTDFDVYILVDKTMDDLIIKFNNFPEGSCISGRYNENSMSACSCPFDM